MAETTETPINRTKTAREEAAISERSKREAEMAELRRLRSEQMSTEKSMSQLTPAEAARKKREEEMEELRRLKAGENEEMRKKLEGKGGTLTTDMDAWRRNQSGARASDHKNKLEAQSRLQGHRGYYGAKTNAADAKASDRKNKLEAQSNLQGHRGYYDSKTNAAMDKDACSQAQRDQNAAMGRMSLVEDGEVENQAAVPIQNGGWKEESAAKEPVKQPVKQPVKEKQERGRSVLFKEAKETIPTPAPKESSPPPPVPEQKMPPKAKDTVTENNTPPSDSDTHRDSLGADILRAPTYSRIDIKFSFGLIVRSTSADGFGCEDLRNNETLRKCMDGTSKILKGKMPNPPDIAKLEGQSSSTFPEAYYDPTLEPTVINIEEDKKNEEGKVTAKGNKRTLVKASFPVFLREEAVDEEGTKRSARILKETKTTVFKALRAAVSGGSFLS